MFRTLTILSLKNWALNIAPLFEANSSQILENKSQELLEDTRRILEDVLEDNNLNYSSIRNNININFDSRWGIRVEANSSEIPFFKYLDQGYPAFDLKPSIFAGKIPKHMSKDGREYVNIPIKNRHSSEVKFRRMYRFLNNTPRNWWHPGYQGRHILDKTIDRASRVVRKKITTSFSEMLGA